MPQREIIRLLPMEVCLSGNLLNLLKPNLNINFMNPTNSYETFASFKMKKLMQNM